MYKAGHYGTAFLVYAPVAFILTYLQLFPHAAIAGLFIIGFTRIPDWDLFIPFVKHRGITHTFVFVLFIGVFAGSGLAGALQIVGDLTAYWLGIPATTENLLYAFGFGFVTGGLSIIAHMLGDIITPMGIQPLRPFRDTRWRYKIAPASSPVANAGLFGLGVGLTIGAIIAGLYLGGWVPAELVEGIEFPGPNTGPEFDPAP